MLARSFGISIGLLLATLLLAVGCRPDGRDGGTDAPPTDATTPPTGDGADAAVSAQDVGPKLTRGGRPPAENDTLMLYYGSDPDTLNLLTANDSVSTAFQRLVYESLADRNMADPSVWEPVLAESWEFDKKNLEFTIHLRKGVKWHPMALPDGTLLPEKEFTSRDVKFTFDCILNEHVEAPHSRSYYVDPEAEDESKRIKIKVTVVDKYTVKIKWTKPYFMADTFTLGIGILPRHVYSVDEHGDPISFDFSSKEFADGFNDHWANGTMCGTGPLIFKEWKKGQQTVMVRNPDYWGEPFFFSRVMYRFQSNSNTALQQAMQNELDWAVIPQKDHYIQSKKHPSVTSGKVVLREFPVTGYRYMGYNLRNAMFRDKRVRWALSHAVPVDEIIKQLYYGLARRTTGPFAPEGPFSDPSIKPIAFDLGKARQLLDEAGWKDTNENGIRDKQIEGKTVEFEFDLMIFSDSPQYLSMAEIIQANFRKIGVSIQLSPTKWALMVQKLRKRDFDATILGWSSDWKGDPFQIWHGSQADVAESSNHVAYQNAEVDKAIETLRVTLDDDKQIELYHKIHRLLYDDQPYTFLFCDVATAAQHSRLENIKFYSQLRPYLDQREWFSNKARIVGQ